MPISGLGTTFGWRGAWFGAWFGPPSGGSSPPGPSGNGTVITGGYGGSQVIVQGYGASGTTVVLGSGGIAWGGVAAVSTPIIIVGNGSDIITGGYGGTQIIVQGYGATGGGIFIGVPAGGIRWGGITGFSLPLPLTFLQALVAMLRGSTALTTVIGAPRIFSTWPGPKVTLPFVLVEDYVESQPGETIEHNVNTVMLAAYGPDKATVKTVLTALMNSVDSPAQNKFSTRVPLQWSTGTEESSWRQPTLPPTRMKMQKSATDLWCWKIQYDFNILPNFQS